MPFAILRYLRLKPRQMSVALSRLNRSDLIRRISTKLTLRDSKPDKAANGFQTILLRVGTLASQECPYRLVPERGNRIFAIAPAAWRRVIAESVYYPPPCLLRFYGKIPAKNVVLEPRKG